MINAIAAVFIASAFNQVVPGGMQEANERSMIITVSQREEGDFLY